MHEEEETLEFAAGRDPPINCTIPGKVGLRFTVSGNPPKKEPFKSRWVEIFARFVQIYVFLSFFAILQNSFKDLEPQGNDFVLFNPNFGAEILMVSRTRHEPRAMILSNSRCEIKMGLRLRHSTCRKWFPNLCNSIYDSIQFFRSVSEGFPEALLWGFALVVFVGVFGGHHCQAVEVPHVHEAAAP